MVVPAVPNWLQWLAAIIAVGTPVVPLWRLVRTWWALRAERTDDARRAKILGRKEPAVRPPPGVTHYKVIERPRISFRQGRRGAFPLESAMLIGLGALLVPFLPGLPEGILGNAIGAVLLFLMIVVRRLAADRIERQTAIMLGDYLALKGRRERP